MIKKPVNLPRICLKEQHKKELLVTSRALPPDKQMTLSKDMNTIKVEEGKRKEEDDNEGRENNV